MPQYLSPTDFHHQATTPTPAIAVFDCDGTLWSPDAGSSFMNYTVETNLLSEDATAWLDARYRLYRAGEIDELAICGEMVQVYAGLPESALRAAAAAFFTDFIEPHIFPELHSLIAHLQREGTEIWAVSSTNNWVIEEGVKRFNIPPTRVLAAQVVIAHGLVTDQLLDVPTDQGKVTALAHAGITAPDAVFGNSVHDAAMLAIARRPFPVNPSPALVAHAHTTGWPVYFPASVKPT